jgi:hypothetical protein
MKRNIFGRVAAFAAVAATVVVAQPAAAQFELNIAGSVNVSNAPLPGNPLDALLDFSANVAAHDNTNLPGLVTFETNPIAFSIGAMNDLVVGEPLLGRPLCVNCPVSPLLTIGPAAGFPGAGAYVFTLNGVTPGTPPADFIFGPVELSSTGLIGTSATMSGFGTVTGGIFGSASVPFTVSFHASFDNDTPAGLVAAITAGGTRNVAFGADFLIATVPEPATVALMGTGLVALLSVGYRRRMNG